MVMGRDALHLAAHGMRVPVRARRGGTSAQERKIVSRFSGSQGRGARRALRKDKHAQAEERNALTSPERRRSFRRVGVDVPTNRTRER